MTRSGARWAWTLVAALTMLGCSGSDGAPNDGGADVTLDGSASGDDAEQPMLDAAEDHTPEASEEADDAAQPDALSDAGADTTQHDDTPQEDALQGDVSEADSAAPDAVEAGPACLSEQDEAAFVAMEQSDDEQAMDACAVGCFFVKACMAECIADTLGFSGPCSDCWADMLFCGVESCIGECPGPDCYDCTVEAGCWVAFETCSGVPATP